MRETLSIFWRKSWDNLGHVVAFNMIWLTLMLPLVVATGVAVRVFVPPPEQILGATPLESTEGIVEGDELEPPGAFAEPMAQQQPEAAGEGTRAGRLQLQWGRGAGAALVFLAAAWLLAAMATGFVYYGMADIVTNYDFSGYRHMAREFLRRGPVVRSAGIVTLYAATLVATVANIFFYLGMMGNGGVLLVVLAGVMLWFALFVTMTFTLALPLAAQRGLGIGESVKVAAILTLASPARSLFILLFGLSVFLLGVMSVAGLGFFAVAAPAILFNADAKARSDRAWGPPAEERRADAADGEA